MRQLKTHSLPGYVKRYFGKDLKFWKFAGGKMYRISSPEVSEIHVEASTVKGARDLISEVVKERTGYVDGRSSNPGRPKEPLVIGPKSYPSRRAAADDLGVFPWQISGYIAVEKALNNAD